MGFKIFVRLYPKSFKMQTAEIKIEVFDKGKINNNSVCRKNF